MTITLPPYYQFLVADAAARAIISEVQGQRLTKLGSLPPSSRSELRDVKAMVRSIPAGYDRRTFTSQLRHALHRLRQEQGMPARATEFYAQVAAYERSRQ